MITCDPGHMTSYSETLTFNVMYLNVKSHLTRSNVKCDVTFDLVRSNVTSQFEHHAFIYNFVFGESKESLSLYRASFPRNGQLRLSDFGYHFSRSMKIKDASLMKM